MRKLFKAKRGKPLGLFLLSGIVALQWSFTSSTTVGKREVINFSDTSAPSPKAVLAANTPARATTTERGTDAGNSSKSNSSKANTKKSSKEEISFGSPTGADIDMTAGKGGVEEKVKKKVVATSGSVLGTGNVRSAGGNVAGTTGSAVGPTVGIGKANGFGKSGGSGNVAGADKLDRTGKVAASGTLVSATTNAVSASEKAVTTPKAVMPAKKMATAKTATVSEAEPNEKAVDDLIRNVSAKMNEENTNAPVKKGVATKKSTIATATKTTSTNTLAASLGALAVKMSVYDSLHLKDAGLSKKVFAMALKGMSKLISAKHIKDNLLAIVDFSQPSNKRRLYVIDLSTYQLLYNTWVAHGMKTGKQVAQSFSNKPESNKSSLGFYVTGPAYTGVNGYSLKLQGVEKGINDHAMDRGIVIHGADYVCEGLIESQGYIGRSWGCPAVAPEISQALIDQLKEGSCLFIYHPSPAYKAKSTLLQ